MDIQEMVLNKSIVKVEENKMPKHPNIKKHLRMEAEEKGCRKKRLLKKLCTNPRQKE